jgi:hypothetical protein
MALSAPLRVDAQETIRRLGQGYLQATVSERSAVEPLAEYVDAPGLCLLSSWVRDKFPTEPVPAAIVRIGEG